METASASNASAPATTTSDVSEGSEASGNITHSESDEPQTLEALAREDDEPAKEKVEKKPPEKKKFKLKVYDEEKEYDEDEVVRMAQRASAADKRFKEAADLEKKYNQAIEKLKEDPQFYFKTLGKDPTEWAEKLLIDKLKLETMSPEQRRAYDLEQELRATKAQLEERSRAEKEQQEAIAKEQYERVKSQQAESLDKSIAEALQSAGHKVSVGLVRRVAQKMLAYHHANDGAQLDAAKAVKLALADRAPEVNEYLEGLTSQDFEKLPATFLKALREHFVGQVTPPMMGMKSKENVGDAPRRTKKVATTTDDFFKNLEKQFSR